MTTEAQPNLGQQLALAIKALEESQEERKEAMADFTQRISNMKAQIRRLSNDIVTGQMQIPLESQQPNGKSKGAGA